jgi:hypothetical protein
MVVWTDARDGGISSYDLYAQRVDGAGNPLWAADGVVVCDETSAQLVARPVSDGAGGVVVTWADTRATIYDVYAQRLNAAGAVQWNPAGAPVCTALQAQLGGVIAADGHGGAIVAWADSRSGNPDIYANRVSPGGAIPTGVTHAPRAAVAAGNSYPNPSSSSASIDVVLESDADVRVDVYDAAGRRVRSIDTGRATAGELRIDFDGRDDGGRALPSGVYFGRIRAGSATATRKIVLQR